MVTGEEFEGGMFCDEVKVFVVREQITVVGHRCGGDKRVDGARLNTLSCQEIS
jgi:hypothetical protein